MSVPLWRQGIAIGQWKLVDSIGFQTSPLNYGVINAGTPQQSTGIDHYDNDAWAGLATDPVNSIQYGGWQGGHQNGGMNALFYLDWKADAPQWAILEPASYDIDRIQNSDGWYPGTNGESPKPASWHHYSTLQWCAGLRKIIGLTQPVVWGDGDHSGRTVASYNVDSRTLDARGHFPDLPTNPTIGPSGLIPANEGMIATDAYGIMHCQFNQVCISFNPATGTWSTPFLDTTWSSYFATGCVDTRRERIFVPTQRDGIGAPHMRDCTGGVLGAATRFVLSGVDETAMPWNNKGAGIIFRRHLTDPSLDVFHITNNGLNGTVYEINAVTGATSVKYTNTTGTAFITAGSGIYNKFAYLPQLGGYVYPINGNNACWFLATEDIAGVPPSPPSPPAPVTPPPTPTPTPTPVPSPVTPPPSGSLPEPRATIEAWTGLHVGVRTVPDSYLNAMKTSGGGTPEPGGSGTSYLPTDTSGTGAASYIGINTQDTVAMLASNFDQRAVLSVLWTAKCDANWPNRYVVVSTGLLAHPWDYPTAYGDDMVSAGTFTLTHGIDPAATSWNQDLAHQPHKFYLLMVWLCYLIQNSIAPSWLPDTPTNLFNQLLPLWEGWIYKCFFVGVPAQRNNIDGIMLPDSGSFQPRGAGWTLASQVQLLHVYQLRGLTSGQAYSWLKNTVEKNFNYLNNTFVTGGGTFYADPANVNNLGWLSNGARPASDYGNTNVAGSPAIGAAFMNAFQCQCVLFAAGIPGLALSSQGATDLNAVANHAAKFGVGMHGAANTTGQFDYRQAGMYSMVTGTTKVNGNITTNFFPDFGAVYVAQGFATLPADDHAYRYLPASSDQMFGSSYIDNILPVLVFAKQQNRANPAAAYARMRSTDAFANSTPEYQWAYLPPGEYFQDLSSSPTPTPTPVPSPTPTPSPSSSPPPVSALPYFRTNLLSGLAYFSALLISPPAPSAPSPVSVAITFDTIVSSGIVNEPVVLHVTVVGDLGGAIVTPYSEGGGTFYPSTITESTDLVYIPSHSGSFNIGIINNSGFANPTPIAFTASGGTVSVNTGPLAPLAMPNGDLELLVRQIMRSNPQVFGNTGLSDVSGVPVTLQEKFRQTAAILIALGVARP